jgi:hypothetical protein
VDSLTIGRKWVVMRRSGWDQLKGGSNGWKWVEVSEGG